MKLTKKQKHSGKYVLTIMVLLIVVALFRDLKYNEFNPETDVCELTCQEVYEGNYENIFLEEYQTWNKFCELESPVINGRWIYNRDKCYDWRPKDECELNPNDEENCVCDEKILMGFTVNEWEYNKAKKNDWILSKPTLDEEKKYKHMINELKSVHGDNIHSYYACIKAHEKNECEKGDRSYIEEEIYEDILINTSFNKSKKIEISDDSVGNKIRCTDLDFMEEGECAEYSTYSIYKIVIKEDGEYLESTNESCCSKKYDKIYHYERLEKEKICRKKKIQDLSCEELKVYMDDCIFGRCNNKDIPDLNLKYKTVLVEYIDGC